MTDWGRDVSFGVFLIPDAGNDLVHEARQAEALRLDWIGVQDHPYQRRFVDTFSLLATIAGATERIGLFPDVACLPLRPPAMMAKAAAGIDILSRGRFEMGLGAGAFWDAIVAYGGERRTPGESLAALEEAVSVMRLVWSGERGMRFDGDFYRLAGAHSGPVPHHPVGIWLGVYGPRALALTGRVADGWVPSFRGDLGQLDAMSARLDAAAVEAGRSPGEIRRVLNLNGEITSGESRGMLHGPVEQWVDDIAALVLDHGFDTFITSADSADHLALFAGEVAPAVRAAVAAARA